MPATPRDRQRYRYENGSLVLRAKGASPADSSPLWFVTGDHAYEFEVEIEADADATAGVLLFYNRRLYGGLGYSAKNLIMHTYGIERPGTKPAQLGRRVHLRVRNDRHIVSFTTAPTVVTWETLRPPSGGLGLSPQRGVRLPQPAAGDLRRRQWGSPLPQL